MKDAEDHDDRNGRHRDLANGARQLFDLLRAASDAAQAGQASEANQLDERAGKLMATGAFPRYLYNYFRRHGAATPEDLVQEVWVTVLTGRYLVTSNPLAFLMRIAKARATDALRTKLRRQGGRTDELPDSDSIVEDVFGRGLDAPSAGLVDCVRRRFKAFAASSETNQARAELLEFKALGLSDKEIASILFDREEEAVSDRELSRIGSRMLEARRAAMPYLEGCEE